MFGHWPRLANSICNVSHKRAWYSLDNFLHFVPDMFFCILQSPLVGIKVNSTLAAYVQQ